MTLVYSIDGTPITQKVAPSGINITHRADGDQSFGGIPIEDPAAALTTVGHRLFTVDETTSATQPRLFTGFITQRDMGRALDEGLFVGADHRLIDLSLVDMNAALAFRQITGVDGNRPAETWAERLTWILESDYLNEFISDDQTWIVTNTTSMEATDYRGAYANAVLDDLVDRSGGAYIYFAFYDTTAHEVRLFFDNDVEVIGACPLSISNVETDVDNVNVFAPTTTSKLAREPDQTYSDVTVTYDRGAKKLYRYRPSTAATYVRRGTEIQRPYTRGLATATAQAEKWLDKHAVEIDRITCSIQVPAASAGLVQAGQSIAARFSHMPGYETGATMRIVSCSPKPTDDTGYWYTIALELVLAVAVVAVCDTNALAGIDAATFWEDWPFDKSDGTNGVTGAENDKTYFPPSVAGAGTWDRDFIYNLPSPITIDHVTVQGRLRGLGDLGDVTAPGIAARARVSLVINSVSYPASSGTTYPDQDIWDPSWTPVSAGNSDITWDLGSEITTSQIILRDTFVSAGGEYWHAFDLFEIATCDLGGAGGSDEIIPLPPAPGSTTEHTTDPTVDDDAAAGYTVGSTWINTTDGGVFVLVDSTTGAAVWVETSPVAGTVYAPTTADYLVGTAQGGLSAEIVVGATPGGELGGTWASPTVDATHSGSAHLALGTTGATAAAGDHAHAGVYVGELLISDTPSTPLVFADILQNEAETDLMYAD